MTGEIKEWELSRVPALAVVVRTVISSAAVNGERAEGCCGCCLELGKLIPWVWFTFGLSPTFSRLPAVLL